MSDRRSWTEVAEPLAIMATAVGAVMAVIVNQVVYVAAPVSLSLLLSWVNRQKLEKQGLQTNSAEIIQVSQQLGNDFEVLRAAVLAMPSQLNLSQLESEIVALDEALASTEENLQNRLSSLETLDGSAIQADLAQLRNQSAYLLETQANVLQRLDTLPLAEKVEGLERYLTERFTALQRQLVSLENLNLTEVQVQGVQLAVQLTNLQEAQTLLAQKLEQLAQSSLPADTWQQLTGLNQKLEQLSQNSLSADTWQQAFSQLTGLNAQLEQLSQNSLPADTWQQLTELNQKLEQLSQNSLPADTWQQAYSQLTSLQEVQTRLHQQLEQLGQTSVSRETWEKGQDQLESQLVNIQNDLQTRLASLDLETVQASSLQLESIRENTSQLGEQLSHLVESLVSVTQQLENLPLPAPSLTTEVFESRLAPLQAQLETLTSTPSGISAEELATRLAPLQAQLETLTSTPSGISAEELTTRLAPLQAQLETLTSTPSGISAEELTTRLAPLQAQLETLTSNPSGISAEVFERRTDQLTEAIAQLQAQLTRLESISATQSSTGGVASDFLENRFTQLSGAINQLQQQLAALEKPDLNPLKDNLLKVRSQLANLEKSLEESATRFTPENSPISSKLPDEAEKWLGKLVQRVKNLQSKEADLEDMPLVDEDDEFDDFEDEEFTTVTPAPKVSISTPPPSPTEPSTEKTRWQCVQTLSGNQSAIAALAITPDSTTLIGSDYEAVKVWNLVTGELQQTLSSDTTEGTVTSVSLSPDGQILACAKGDIELWNLSTGQLIRTLEAEDWTTIVAMSPDGKTLASSGGDPVDQNSSLQIWDLTTGELTRTNYYVACEIASLAFSADGQMLALTGSNLEANKGIIQLWHLETGKPRFTIEPAVIPYGVAFNPESSMLAVGCSDQTVKLWNAGTGGLVQTFTGHLGGVYTVAISPDGKLLASGSEDETLIVWALETGEKLQTLSGHSGGIRAIALSQNGTTLVSGSQDRTLKVWQYA